MIVFTLLSVYEDTLVFQKSTILKMVNASSPGRFAKTHSNSCLENFDKIQVLIWAFDMS
jgi:hypothetical protein